MSNPDPQSADDEVQVVQPATVGGLAARSAIGFVLALLLLAAGAVAIWASSDRRHSAASLAPDTASAVTDSAAPTTVESTTTSTSTSTTTSTTTISTSTTTVSSEPGDDNPQEIPTCTMLMPNLVGRTLYETAGPLTPCLNQFILGRGPAVNFEIYTVGETCTSDLGLFDRIESQSPSQGTPFAAGTVRVDVSFYRNCSAPTTSMLIPPPPPIPPTTPTTPDTSSLPPDPGPPAP